MINFRFHVVSIVAVFLSLALGIMIGSTVVDRAIVASLRSQIQRVEANADAQRAENSALTKELGLKADYVKASASFAVTGRLSAVPLAVIADPNVSADNIVGLIELSRNAGSGVGGYIRLTDKWSDDSQVSELRRAAGVQERGARLVRAGAWSAVATRIAAGTDNDSQNDVLVSLVSSGFIEYKSVDDSNAVPAFPAEWPGIGARAVYISAPMVGAAASQSLQVAERVTSLARQGMFVVAAEDHLDGDGIPSRGGVLSNVLDDASVRIRISSVDDVELVEGRVAVVLAAADLARGVNGKYGYGDGVVATVPVWWAL